MYKGYFLNGKPVGKFIRYYPHGAIKAKMNYKSNSVYAALFNDKGKLVARGRYLGQKKDSTWTYYRNNIIVGTEDYKHGVVDGYVNKYFFNGKIADSKKWKKGKRHGDWERYYKSGEVKCKGEYKEGKLHGKFISYTESGIIDIEGFFMHNLREGTWCFYNNSGEFLFKVDYKKGVPENLEDLENKENEQFKRLKNSELNFVDPQDYIDSPEEYMMKSKRAGKK
jgi:antitoxin component YwqK of YwqJK toxin-antitoxin module